MNFIDINKTQLISRKCKIKKPEYSNMKNFKFLAVKNKI